MSTPPSFAFTGQSVLLAPQRQQGCPASALLLSAPATYPFEVPARQHAASYMAALSWGRWFVWIDYCIAEDRGRSAEPASSSLRSENSDWWRGSPFLHARGCLRCCSLRHVACLVSGQSLAARLCCMPPKSAGRLWRFRMLHSLQLADGSPAAEQATREVTRRPETCPAASVPQAHLPGSSPPPVGPAQHSSPAAAC